MTPIPRLVEAVHVRDYVLRIRFSDGTQGEVDLENELAGEIFEPLRDPTYFKGFQVNPDVHTVTWPNGADFAPEFLYERVRIAA